MTETVMAKKNKKEIWKKKKNTENEVNYASTLTGSHDIAFSVIRGRGWSVCCAMKVYFSMQRAFFFAYFRRGQIWLVVIPRSWGHQEEFACLPSRSIHFIDLLAFPYSAGRVGYKESLIARTGFGLWAVMCAWSNHWRKKSIESQRPTVF